MQVFKKYSLIVLFLFIATLSFSQGFIPKKDYVPEVRKSRYSFSICLIAGVNSSPISFGIMRQMPDSSHEVTFVSRSTFILQLSGAQKSLANPDQINYLEEYEIDISVIDDLWKLKYDKYPYGKREDPGWGGQSGMPSAAQFQMLSEFGVEKIHDHCFGDNLIKLLIKMDDPMWVGQYQNRR